MERSLIYLFCLIFGSCCFAICPSRWPPNGKLKRQENLEASTEDPIFGLDPATSKKKDRYGENIWLVQSYSPHHYFNGFLISVTDIGPATCGNSSLVSLNDESKTWTGCDKVLRNTETKEKSFMPFQWILPKCGCAVLRATVIARHNYYYLENEDIFDAPLAKTICKNEDTTIIQTEPPLINKATLPSRNEFSNSVMDSDEFPEDRNASKTKLVISYITDPMIDEIKEPLSGFSIMMRNVATKISQSCTVILDGNKTLTSNEQNNTTLNATCLENHEEIRTCCILSEKERFKCFVDLKALHIEQLCNSTLRGCAWKWDSWSFQNGQHKCCQETGTERHNCFNHTFWDHHKEAFDVILTPQELSVINDSLNLNFTVESTSLVIDVLDEQKNQVDNIEILGSSDIKYKVDDTDTDFNEDANQVKEEINHLDIEPMILNVEKPFKHLNTSSTENINIKQTEDERKFDTVIQPHIYKYCCRNGMEASSEIKILLYSFRQCQEMSETFYRKNSDLVNDEIECQNVFRNCCIKHAMRPLVKRGANKKF